MALTGNTVQSTYLDLVQLEQSGAGLPSHAGKEAALYDGSGAQVVGRSAVRDWMDPHPDAAAFDETWEFSTTGDMTQGQLETAGWTFSDATAEVSNGTLWITSAASANPWARAFFSTSLSGDFDIIATFTRCNPGETEAQNTTGGAIGTVGVGVNGSPGSLHQCDIRWSTDRSYVEAYHTGTWTGGAGTGLTSSQLFTFIHCARILRISGTIYFLGAPNWPYAALSRVAAPQGWKSPGNVADSSTFDRVHLSNWVAVSSNNQSSATFGIRSIRRFA